MKKIKKLKFKRPSYEDLYAGMMIIAGTFSLIVLVVKFIKWRMS